MWVTGGKSKSSTFREDPPYQMEYVRRTLAKPKIEDKDKRKKSWIARFIAKHIYEWDPTFKYSTRMLITVGVAAVAIWELTVAVSTFSHLLTDPLQSIDFGNSESSSSEMSYSSTTLNSSSPTPMDAHSDLNRQRDAATSTPMLSNADLARLRHDFNACLALGVDFIKELGYASCDYKNETLIYYDEKGNVAKSTSIPNPFPTVPPTPTAATNNNNDYDNNGSETEGGESGIRSKIEKLTDFVKDFITFFARAFPACIGVSIAFSTTIVALHLPHLLMCYRKHMKRLYRGDKFFLPSSKKAPVKLVAPLSYVWLFLLFLQHSHWNTFRAAQADHESGAGNYHARTPRSIHSPRGWESLDKGFKSYVSFIVMEHEFCNPYVATFIYLLQQNRDIQSNKQTELVSAHTNSGGFITYKSRLNRNRWLVAYTLINNPALLANRRVDKLERASLITRSLSKTVSVNSTTALETVLLEEYYLSKPPPTITNSNGLVIIQSSIRLSC
ncbi:uncharacterized protein LOC134177387 isoform X1 [Corticium candelabrum]|uniref:uncharacterized protein LOC134177387 isoform X1 n=1 Tax=Corticium candelabrum TaxID=121492 RepID=UPI002E2680B5|nr:uncharacterized protein LOC134177387 isoform X1 [Corticium candelabrum]